MEMKKEEIIVRYREAKKKSEQITILAQLNATSEDKIREILKEAGYLTHGRKKQSELPEETEKHVESEWEKWKPEKEIEKENVEKEENSKSASKAAGLPDVVLEAINKQMIIEQEKIDHHSERLKVLSSYLNT